MEESFEIPHLSVSIFFFRLTFITSKCNIKTISITLVTIIAMEVHVLVIWRFLSRKNALLKLRNDIFHGYLNNTFHLTWAWDERDESNTAFWVSETSSTPFFFGGLSEKRGNIWYLFTLKEPFELFKQFRAPQQEIWKQLHHKTAVLAKMLQSFLLVYFYFNFTLWPVSGFSFRLQTRLLGHAVTILPSLDTKSEQASCKFKC